MHDWVDLFDPIFRERACEQLREDVAVPALPRFPWIARDLLAMLASYERHVGRETDGIVAARELAQQVTRCSDLAERGELTDSHATRLRELWLELVAAGAAYRIYDDLPRERTDRSVGGRRSGETRRKLAEDRAQQLLDELAHALNRLLAVNDFRAYRLAEVEAEAGKKAGKTTLAQIRRRANELVEK